MTYSAFEQLDIAAHIPNDLAAYKLEGCDDVAMVTSLAQYQPRKISNRIPKSTRKHGKKVNVALLLKRKSLDKFLLLGKAFVRRVED